MSSDSSRRETEKYIKFFTYKSLQVVVNSRSGEKSRTSSKANAVGVDWFNVALPGSSIESEIQKEVRSEFSSKTAVVQEPLWLNVYLKTAEGHDSLLETWNLSFVEKSDQNVKNCSVVYNKLSLLLKSLIAVTRSLPAYKLTRRKDKDFSFYYKIMAEPPSKAIITQLPEKTKVGAVSTQFGSVSISVFFKMDVRLDASLADSASILGKINKKVKIDAGRDEQTTFLNPLGPAAVEELTKAALDDVVGSTASFPTSFSTASPHHFDLSQMQEGLEKLHLENISGQQSIGNIDDEHRPVAAFANAPSSENSTSTLPEIPSTPPLLSFIQGKMEESMMESCFSGESKPFNDAISIRKTDTQDQNKAELAMFDEGSPGEPTAQAVGYEDDFVLVEVRPAFAPQFGDAGQLYRDCQNPPKLDMFSEVQNDTESLTDKIEQYELQFEKYNEFFQNLEHMRVT